MTVAAVEEDRRRAILDAAVTVVVERGYAAARVSDIARRAGTSTGTVHYYYPTKVDVLDAALQHASERSHSRHRADLVDHEAHLRNVVPVMAGSPAGITDDDDDPELSCGFLP